jgi:hypothetical protein
MRTSSFAREKHRLIVFEIRVLKITFGFKERKEEGYGENYRMRSLYFGRVVISSRLRWSVPSQVPSKISYAFLVSHLRVTCPANTMSNLIVLTALGEGYRRNFLEYNLNLFLPNISREM